MADLTNAKIANTYKDLLQVNAETSNAGLDGTVRTIQDGGGTASPIAMSTAQLNVTGQFALAGTVLTATADQLNNLAVGKLDTLTAGDDTVKLTIAGVSVSTATVSATVVVNPVLSLTEVDAATGSFNTKVSATNFVAGTGSFTTKVSGVAAEFSGNVSAANVYASTNIFVAGESIPSAITSVNAVIAAVSALTSVNKAAITSINAGPASTFDALTVKTSITVGPDTGGNKSININSSDGIASLEIGGETNAFIDLKTPRSDDFDLRLGSSGTGGYIRPAEGESLSIIGSSETLATFTDDGSVALYHNNVKKLETAADGVDIDDINLGGKVLTITGDTSDTFTITTGAAGATTLATTDAASNDGHITLAPDGYIVNNAGKNGTYFQIGGTSYGLAGTNGSTTQFILRSLVSDGDFIIQGNDGGSTIDALTFDMSEAGTATFNHDIIIADLGYIGSASFPGAIRISASGNLTVYKDIYAQQSIRLATDGPALQFGAGGEIDIIHVHDVGLNFKNSLTTNAGGFVLTLQSAEAEVVTDDVIGAINFQTPDESSSGDSRLVAAGIEAVAEQTFNSTANTTKLKFKTAVSETATEKMTLTGAGNLGIGNTSPTSTLHVTGDATVDDINLNGKVLTITGDTGDTFTITSGGDGATTLATTDAAGANGHLTLNPDGKMLFDVGNDFGEFSLHRQSSMYMQIFTDNSTAGTLYIKAPTQDADIKIAGNDGGVSFNALTFDMSEGGAATFNNRVTAAALTVDNIDLNFKTITITGDTNDTFTITSGAAGATTLETVDAAGNDAHLQLVADGYVRLDSGAQYGQVFLNKDGTNYGEFFTGGSDFNIRSNVSDQDMRFNGNDGGVLINALRLDMSAAGAAYFNNDINAAWGDDRFVRMYYDDSYHMGMHMEADTRDLILYTKSADNSGDIRFKTGSTPTERMTILADGKVGIGAATPSDNLHIASTGSAGIFIQADTDNADETHVPTLSMASDGGGAGQFILGIEGNAGTAFTGSLANANYIHAKNSTSQPLQFANASQLIMTLTDGKVGIGTSAPSELLHIASTGDANLFLEADTDNAGGEDHNPKVMFSQDGGGVTGHIGLNNANQLDIYNSFAADMRFGTTNTERMRIKPGGNVGINVTDPLKKLHVNGPALSTVQTLTDASTVTSDFDVGQNFTLTLAGNRTLGAPSNVDAGQVGSIFIIQDGTGSRTLAYNSIWKFAGGTAPTLSTAAGAIDRLDYIVQSGTAIQAVLTKAYA